MTLPCPEALSMLSVIRQRHTYSAAFPSAWNGLPVALRLMSDGPLCSIFLLL